MSITEIITALLLIPAGFAAGAAGTVYWKIIRPIRPRLGPDTRALHAVALRLREQGATMLEIQRITAENQPRVSRYAIPKDEIPTTIRKSYF